MPRYTAITSDGVVTHHETHQAAYDAHAAIIIDRWLNVTLFTQQPRCDANHVKF